MNIDYIIGTNNVADKNEWKERIDAVERKLGCDTAEFEKAALRLMTPDDLERISYASQTYSDYYNNVVGVVRAMYDKYAFGWDREVISYMMMTSFSPF